MGTQEHLFLPDYKIRRYTDQIYKVTHFKGSRLPRLAPVEAVDKQEPNHYENKLENSISRSRKVILELALCNDWEWFATLTISQDNFDRADLKSWDRFLKQWLRDRRKAYGGIPLPFLLVPEPHRNGLWHMHGLFGADLSPHLSSFRECRSEFSRLPRKLVDGDYYFWPDYYKRFGYCSFGRVRDKVRCAFYVTKYLSKALGSSSLPLGSHLYAPSKGLRRASDMVEVWGERPELDKFCTQNYDFCSTGFTSVDDGLSWAFALDYDDFSALHPLESPSDDDTSPEVQDIIEYEQLVLSDTVPSWQGIKFQGRRF